MTTLIFDGDDTLWATMHLYSSIKDNFIYEMEKLGFKEKEVRDVFEAIDLDNFKQLGFSIDRFPKSFGDTYEYLCKLYNKNCYSYVKNLYISRAYQVFYNTPTLIEGAESVLLSLKEQEYRLILATKGDFDIQRRRIEQTNIGKHFSRIYVFDHKKDAEFLHIINDLNLDVRYSWSIGNSIKSDINPALRLGMWAIFIPNDTWAYESEDIMSSAKLIIAHSITDIPRILQEMNK
jgi:putative hydrolase of the HAD superfamily